MTWRVFFSAKFTHILKCYFLNCNDWFINLVDQFISFPHVKSANEQLGVNPWYLLMTGWMRRPQAQRSWSIPWHRWGPTYKSRLLHAINFWSYREVWSEAATGTSPTETSGGWGTLHPSKQVSLPRGQHQQYPIHYKGQKEKEGGKQGGERNNKHLFTVTVVTFSPIFSMIYDQLLEKPCGGLIGLGGCRTVAPIRGVKCGQNYVECSTKSTDLNLNNAARRKWVYRMYTNCV